MATVNNCGQPNELRRSDTGFYPRMKMRMLCLLGGLSIVFLLMATGLRGAGATGWLMLDLLWWLVASVLVALWAVYDHGQRGAGELDWDQMLFVFWPLTLLFWLVRTRGFKGCLFYLGFWLLVVLPSGMPWLIFT